MSKAFTKESDGDEGGDELPEDPSIPKNVKNYMTPAGAERLKGELKQLLTVDRPELVKVISWAASNGDRSENGDYIYGKRRLRQMDSRIRLITKRLESAEIVDPSKQNGDRVLFGATVVIENEGGQKKKYRIVGIDEADVKNGAISWISPLAKALLNSKKGDVVTLRTPKGEEEIEVVSISYTG